MLVELPHFSFPAYTSGAMLTRLPSVYYTKKVSDLEIKLILQCIADAVGSNLSVHSGDRDFRPKGGAKRSLHMAHRAADIHAEGISDAVLFRTIKAEREKIFTSFIHRYQVLHHGKYTETEGEHVHIGDYQFIKAVTMGPGITFLIEGMTPKTKGVYSEVA